MKNLALICAVVMLLSVITSCKYLNTSSDTKVIYTVKSASLNIRKSYTTKSEILGKLHKGDTVFPTQDYSDWIEFEYNGKKAYVSSDHLTGHTIPDLLKVSNMKLGKTQTFIRNYLDDYVNWRTGRFWLIFLVLIGLSFGMIKTGKSLEDNMYSANYDGFAYNHLPHFAAVIGGLFSYVYMIEREDVLQAMFVTKFYWIPSGDQVIEWYLWSVSLLGIMGLVYFWIKDFVHYGIRGIFPALYYTLTAFVTFNTGIYGGIIVLLFVSILIIAYLSSYILGSFVTDSISKSSSIQKSGLSKEMENVKRNNDRDRKEADERREIQHKIDWE